MGQYFKLNDLRPSAGVKRDMKRFFRKIGMKRYLANSRGYSIPELVAVLAIIGIFMSTAVPNYSLWALSRQVDAKAKKLYMDLQLARITAIKNNNDVVVNFNTFTNQYTIHDDTNSDGTVNGVETVKTIPLIPRIQFGFSGAGVIDPDGGAVANSVAIAGGGNIITFNSRGQVSQSGSVYLIPVSEVGQSDILLRAISFVQATGGVDYWEYDQTVNPPWS